jgi:hypothetical protein
MKVLLAISSWPMSAENGDHDASRRTWLTRAKGLDYRFFMGDGTSVAENEALIDEVWQRRPAHYSNKLAASVPFSYAPQADEVMFSVPYDFKHLPFKVREIFRWAWVRGYDYVFKADTDTYVDVPRLLASGFQEFDYVGTPFFVDGQPFGHGGAGYWVSRAAFKLFLDAPIATSWDDIWTGQILFDHNIPLHVDYRYQINSPHNFSAGPQPGNQAITSHLGFSPEPFDHNDMFLAHRLRELGQ